MSEDKRTGTRLKVLENETHGDLALGQTISVGGGWSGRQLPSGEKIITVELDYHIKDDTHPKGFEWGEEHLATFQETIPSGTFTSVYSCDCKMIDMTSTQYKCSLAIGIKELFGTLVTDKVTVQPMEVAWFKQNYTAPISLHAVWTVRGV